MWPIEKAIVVRTIWETTCKERLRGMLEEERKRAMRHFGVNDISKCKGYNIGWIRLDIWDRLVDNVWNTDAWKNRSMIGKQNRMVEKDGSITKHTGGSIPFMIHAERMEKELNRKATYGELFNRTHKRDKGVAGHIMGTPQDAAESEEKYSEKSEAARMFKLISESTETYEAAVECLNINYYGTKRVTEELIPLLRLSDFPRIVNLSSIFGKLEFISNEMIAKKLSDRNGITGEGLDELLKSFLNDFKEGKVESNGWPIGLSAYKVSKMVINAYTRILAKKFPTFCINSIHPGFVRTDMTGSIGTMSPEEGAKGPVMLALLPKDGPSGYFYMEDQQSYF